jgi:predicted molibdopterin-dependent oxidoreductase YjgC
VEVEVEEDKLVGAERKSFLPAGKRLECHKLKAASDIVYSPDRLMKPLVKEKRGLRHGFREASWDEALDLVAGKFKYFKERYGAESIGWLRGMEADGFEELKGAAEGYPVEEVSGRIWLDPEMVKVTM